MPDKRGLKPAYDQKNFTEAEKRGKLRLIASPDGRDGSVQIRQDNELYATVLSEGDSVKHALKPDRYAYVQVARGTVKLNGKPLDTGDGAAISAEKVSRANRSQKTPKSCSSTWHEGRQACKGAAPLRPNRPDVRLGSAAPQSSSGRG